jgi:hypothetical protein
MAAIAASERARASDSERFAELNRYLKEDLIYMFLTGVRQPDGRRLGAVGPASALRKLRKIELINSLLEIGWPGSDGDD